MSKRKALIKEQESEPILDCLIDAGYLSADVKSGVATLAVKKDKVKKASYWLLVITGLVVSVCGLSAIAAGHYADFLNWQAVDLNTIHIPESVTEQLNSRASASEVSGSGLSGISSMSDNVISMIGSLAKFALIPLLVVVVGAKVLFNSSSEDSLLDAGKMFLMGMIPIGGLMMASSVLSVGVEDHIEVKPPEVIFTFSQMKDHERMEKALTEAVDKLKSGGVYSQDIDYITAQMLAQVAKRNTADFDWRTRIDERMKRVGQQMHFGDEAKRIYAIDHVVSGKASTQATQEYENKYQSKVTFFKTIGDIAKLIALPLLLLGGFTVFLAKKLSSRLWRIRSTIERMRTIQIKTETE